MSSERYFASLRDIAEVEMAHLNALDAALGDGDHGTSLLRGLTRATSAEDGLRAKAFMRASGGASGTLFGLVLHEIELHLDTGTSLANGLARAEARIRDLGQVQPGDKSMLDALAPAVAALQDGDLTAAVKAAGEGRDATVAMVARRGRAQYVEGGGQGHIDPGAVSLTMMLTALAETDGV